MKKKVKIITLMDKRKRPSSPSYGSELIIDGDMNTPASWSTLNCDVSGGTGNLNVPAANSLLYQSIVTNGTTYKVEFDVTNFIAGDAELDTRVMDNGGVSLFLIPGNGYVNFEYTHTDVSDNILWQANNNGVYSIDNVSVKEVL